MKIKGDVYFCAWTVQYPALRGITLTRMGAKARGPGNSVCHKGITQSWGSSGCALASLTVCLGVLGDSCLLSLNCRTDTEK